jgi:hypothetical protein
VLVDRSMLRGTGVMDVSSAMARGNRHQQNWLKISAATARCTRPGHFIMVGAINKYKGIRVATV